MGNPAIIVFSALCAFATLIVILFVWRSPEGHEDENGFHFGPKASDEEGQSADKEDISWQERDDTVRTRKKKTSA
ncbi:MAG TPA: hypothetical protein VKC60_05205 [Opitutaceae bacterium]|nr:hypothetical protein [Opitutaceae bacterium]